MWLANYIFSIFRYVAIYRFIWIQNEMNDDLNENLIDTFVFATVDHIHQPLREEVVNHASKQLFAYISAKARERQKKSKKSVTTTIVWMVLRGLMPLKQNGE